MGRDFFDSTGNPYPYLDDGDDTIYSFDGRPIAYVKDDSVYGFSGAHLGFFEDGHIWDHSGSAVLFTAGASGGPMKPSKSLKPLKGLKQLKPLKGLRQLKPLRTLKRMSWSELAPTDIFEQ